VKTVCFFGLKGGVGKTTLAAAATAAALEGGYATAILDLEGSNAGLTEFVNRRRTRGLKIPHVVTPPLRSFMNAANSKRATEEMQAAVGQASLAGADCLIVDTSSSRDALWMNAAAILACSVLVTPVTDSPIDLEVLLAEDKVQSVTDFVHAAAGYRGRNSFRWIVARSRRGHLHTRLGDRVGKRLEEAAKAQKFDIVEGLRERVGYREMFEDGRSPLDAPQSNQSLAMSVLSARGEMRALLAALDIRKRSEPSPWLTRAGAGAETPAQGAIPIRV
jgi:chromosome partitioning protein